MENVEVDNKNSDICPHATSDSSKSSFQSNVIVNGSSIALVDSVGTLDPVNDVVDEKSSTFYLSVEESNSLSSASSRLKFPRNMIVSIQEEVEDIDLSAQNSCDSAGEVKSSSPRSQDLKMKAMKLFSETNISSQQGSTASPRRASMGDQPTIFFSRTNSFPQPSPKTGTDTLVSTGSLHFQSFSEIRNRDIRPESNSAADKALQMVTQAVAAASNKKKTEIVANLDINASTTRTPSRRGTDNREIQQGAPQYALTYGMMLGIRVTVGQASLQPFMTSLVDADYSHKSRLSFPPEGSPTTPSHRLPYQFKFKDYAPKAFRRIRELSGIDEADYVLSLAGDFNYIEFLANSKSGQYFFYSHCGKYMIKTQTKRECCVLRRMLPEYINHLTKNPNSLLVRFYAMHRVKMPVTTKGKIHFVVMSSVFDSDIPIHIKYDLKGCTVGRVTSDEDCAKGHVQKDLNLMKSGRILHIGSKIGMFRRTLQEDSQFLAERGIMDYSLLVGVHDGASSRMGQRHKSVILAQPTRSSDAKRVSRESASLPPLCEWRKYHNGIQSGKIGSKEVYFLGIIDILQVYNTKKQAEHLLRGLRGQDRKQISCVPPQYYAERFTTFLMRHTNENLPPDALELDESANSASCASQSPDKSSMYGDGARPMGGEALKSSP